MNRSLNFSRRIRSRWTPSFISIAQQTFARKSSNADNRRSEELFRPLPAHLYNDASFYQFERENIFAKNWIYAGQADRLSKLGDYLSIILAGYPIFVYRSPLTKDLIAFQNVCSHRAGPIVPINCNNFGLPLYGNQSLLKCQYHAWLYDSRDGTLKATPNFHHQFSTEEKKCLSLKRINLQIFAEQFLFVQLIESEEKPSINTLLSDLLNDMMDFPLDQYRHLQSEHHRINCNWKTYVENYQEGYHIQSIHPQLNQVLQSKEYSVTNKKNTYSIHHAPSRHDRSDQEKYLWVFIYPNLAINLYEKGYSIEQILPIGKDRTIVSYDFFVRHSSDSNQMTKRLEEAKETVRRTLAITSEDQGICEQVQSNLNAGIYKAGYLSPTMENGVQFFQNRIRNELQQTNWKFD